MWTIVPLVISAAYLPSTNFTNWHFKNHLVNFIFSRTKVSWTSLKVDSAHCRIQELSGGLLASEQGVEFNLRLKGIRTWILLIVFRREQKTSWTTLDYFFSLLTHKSQNALVFQEAKKIPISNSFCRATATADQQSISLCGGPDYQKYFAVVWWWKWEIEKGRKIGWPAPLSLWVVLRVG